MLVLAPLAASLSAPLAARAAEAEPRIESAPIDVRDLASLQAGARTFVNYCLNCHAATLMRYNRLRDLGLSERQIMDNLMFTADKIGEMMTVAMTRKDAADWFGPAPDLSVIARSRGADWLWSFLRGFYRDPSSPTGWNNTVFEGVGMPHALWKLQGERVLREEVMKDAAGKEMKDSHGNLLKTAKLQALTPGTLSPLEYDMLARDLVNFLVWMGEPTQVFRRQVGIVVVAYLFGLTLLAYFLYREFWKDVH
ncbi:MAG: cytochrome c1 [Betaproteobacteria bacterium]|nr:cytochrome c1 [Betaproteobacteria bacterium]